MIDDNQAIITCSPLSLNDQSTANTSLSHNEDPAMFLPTARIGHHSQDNAG